MTMQQHGHSFKNGIATFRVWAPKCKTIELETQNEPALLPMDRSEDGWFEVTAENIKHGDAYRFRIDGEKSRPDPAAHSFEASVHDWNLAIDHGAFKWKTADWKGVAKRDLIIYELHIGTFTESGTFLSTIERIDELIELGINAIEVLPVAQCPGVLRAGRGLQHFLARLYSDGFRFGSRFWRAWFGVVRRNAEFLPSMAL